MINQDQPATGATNQFNTINIPTKKRGPDWLQRKLQVIQDSKFPFQFSMLYSNQTEHDKYKTNAALFPFLDTSEPNPRSQNEKNNFQLRSNQKQTNHYHPIHNKKVKKWRKKKSKLMQFQQREKLVLKMGIRVLGNAYRYRVVDEWDSKPSKTEKESNFNVSPNL